MSSYSKANHCTVEYRTGKFCDRLRAEDMPFPICFDHAIMIFKRMQQALTAADPELSAVSAVIENALQSRRSRTSANSKRHKVYYVMVGDLIKIGTTGNSVETRLRSYPPGADLLATEWGGRSVELERHQQFAHLLAERKEWFHPGPDLLDHIAKLSN